MILYSIYIFFKFKNILKKKKNNEKIKLKYNAWNFNSYSW